MKKLLIAAIIAASSFSVIANTIAPQIKKAIQGVPVSSHKVVVYYRDYCTSCHALMGKLKKLGVKFTAIDAEGKGIPFVPVLKVDGKMYVGDRSIGELKRILK